MADNAKMMASAVALVTAEPEHISQLLPWFSSQQAMMSWGGPGMRFPTNQVQFLRDIGWLRLASVALIPAQDVILPANQQSVLGFAQIYSRAGRYHIGRVAISPEKRGEGLGQYFLQEVMNGIRLGKDIKNIEQVKANAAHPEGFMLNQAFCLPFTAEAFSLFVLPHNTAAIRCYQALGFEEAMNPEPLPKGTPECLYMTRSV